MSFVSPFSLTGWVQRKSNTHLPLTSDAALNETFEHMERRVPSSASMKDFFECAID